MRTSVFLALSTWLVFLPQATSVSICRLEEGRVCLTLWEGVVCPMQLSGVGEGEELGPGSYPEEGVQSTVLHELGENHDWPTFSDHALQSDYVGVVKLAHDGGLTEEVPPLPLRVAHLQCLDGHKHLPAAWLLQPTPAHFPKFPCRAEGTGRKWLLGLALYPVHAGPFLG